MTEAEKEALRKAGGAAAAAETPSPPPATPAVAEAASTPTPPAQAAADPAAIAELCANTGAAGMAAALIREGATLDQAKERVNEAGQIRAAVDSARKLTGAIDPKLADRYLAAGASLAHVRADLFAKVQAAQGPEVRGTHSPAAGSSGGPSAADLGSGAIYKARADARAARSPTRH